MRSVGLQGIRMTKGLALFRDPVGTRYRDYRPGRRVRRGRIHTRVGGLVTRSAGVPPVRRCRRRRRATCIVGRPSYRRGWAIGSSSSRTRPLTISLNVFSTSRRAHIPYVPRRGAPSNTIPRKSRPDGGDVQAAWLRYPDVHALQQPHAARSSGTFHGNIHRLRVC